MNITKAQLNALSIQELSQLNRMVVDLVKSKRADENRSAIYEFRSGDLVSFNSRSGMKVNGEVLQVKRTKIVVKTPAGNYLVPASMLNRGV